MASKRLTDISTATGLTLSDFVHIVITGDTSQNSAGSSYKASLQQIKDVFNLTTGFTNTNIYNSDGSLNSDRTVTQGTYKLDFLGSEGSRFRAIYTGTTNPSDYSQFEFNLSNSGIFHYDSVINTYFNATLLPGNTSIGVGINLTNEGAGVNFNAYGGNLQYSDGVNTKAIQVDSIGISIYTSGATRYYFPNTDGSNGQVLTTDGAGIVSWQYPTGGGTFTGNTSATCITDLYVTNVYGCSPITIHDSVQSTSSNANGGYSFAYGRSVNANGDYSWAEGFGTISDGDYSHSQGRSTQSVGLYSHAEGGSTQAIGESSHAEGDTTQTGTKFAYYAESVVSGVITLSGSYGDVSSNFGTDNLLFLYDEIFDNAYGKAVFPISQSYFSSPNTIIELYDTSVNTTTAYVGDITNVIGGWFGDQTIPANYAHAEGQYSIALGDYAHAEGLNNEAIGNVSHAEGNQTQAIGSNSHAEGEGTQAVGLASHAEGSYTQANGDYSHAEGSSTQAVGLASHAEGYGTITNGLYQHASGKYNVTGDTTQGAFIIGNGTSNTNRSNLLFAGGNIVNISGKTITTTLQVISNPNNNYVLTSDSNGNATWQPSYTFTGNTSGNCITDLFVSNIYGCSPLHIEPSGLNDVYIVENGGKVGIGTSSPTAKLHINNTGTTDSILVEDSTNPDITPFVVDSGGTVFVGDVSSSWDGFSKMEISGSYLRINKEIYAVYVKDSTDLGLNGSFRFGSTGGKLSFNKEGIGDLLYMYCFGNNDNVPFGTYLPLTSVFRVGGNLTWHQSIDQYTKVAVRSDFNGAGTYALKMFNSSDAPLIFVDNSTKVGIGISSPTETLDVSGKTKTINLQVTSGATTGYVLKSTDNNGNSSWQPITPGPTNYGLFAQTGDSTVISGTTAESTLIGGGLGTLSVPANGFQVGDSFQANLSGHISAKNNDKLQIKVITTSGVTLANTGQITMPQCTGQHWDLKINFTIRKLGAAGIASIASTVMFTYTKDASNAFEGENISIVNNTTFDTTIDNTLDITAQWNVASDQDIIYSELFTLFKTY